MIISNAGGFPVNLEILEDSMENIAEPKNTLDALSHDLAHIVEQVSPSVVAVNARRHLSSSGVYWRDSIIVTAAHTIRRTDGISVILASGHTVTATLAGADPSTDLAVLKVDSTELRIPSFGDPSRVNVGHLVLAIGRGAEKGLNATLGIVGVLSGAWRSWRGGLIDQFIGLDLVLHPGAAGGPLMDAQGHVLGINTLGLSRNMALTVPASTVNRVVADLLEKGHLGRGYLGLGMRPIPLPENLKSALNLSADSGLIVVSVEPDGPAGKAGVLFGDVIVALEGAAVSNIRDLQAFLEPESVGKTIPVSMIRGGKTIEINVTVGERRRRE
jgi:S1-C subfamily serine protease